MKITNGQRSVLEAFKTLGSMDDTALAVYVHHIADTGMSSSGIRTRRRELQDLGLVTVVGTKRLASGRSAAIHGITKAGKAVLRSRSRSAVAA